MFGMQLTATKLDKNAPKESPVRKTNIHLGKDHVVIKPDLKVKEEKAKPVPVVSSTRLRKPTSKYEASAPKTGMNWVYTRHDTNKKIKFHEKSVSYFYVKSIHNRICLRAY